MLTILSGLLVVTTGFICFIVRMKTQDFKLSSSDHMKHNMWEGSDCSASWVITCSRWTNLAKNSQESRSPSSSLANLDHVLLFPDRTSFLKSLTSDKQFGDFGASSLNIVDTADQNLSVCYGTAKRRSRTPSPETEYLDLKKGCASKGHRCQAPKTKSTLWLQEAKTDIMSESSHTADRFNIKVSFQSLFVVFSTPSHSTLVRDVSKEPKLAPCPSVNDSFSFFFFFKGLFRFCASGTGKVPIFFSLRLFFQEIYDFELTMPAARQSSALGMMVLGVTWEDCHLLLALFWDRTVVNHLFRYELWFGSQSPGFVIKGEDPILEVLPIVLVFWDSIFLGDIKGFNQTLMGL